MPADTAACFQTSTNAAEHLLITLQDIATHVQLRSEFCIHHPDYKPFELPKELLARLQTMPREVRARYQRLLLRSFLYGVYYNGSMRVALAQETDSEDLPRDLENNTFLGVDLDFFNRLHKSNSGTGYFDAGWHVLGQEDGGSLAVTKGGLRLHVDRDCHLHPEQRTATVGDAIAIRLPKNLLQNGFYVAAGNETATHQTRAGKDPVTVRIYFNLTSQGAVAVMGSLTRALNSAVIPFRFKVLYNPEDYGRYDAGVLYFDKDYYPSVQPVLEIIYSRHRHCFRPNIPLFTRLLAPGLGVAEEPDYKFADRESFGMNRCRIVADGLLESWQRDNDSPKERITCIKRHFSSLGLDWNRPYLNAHSKDLYTPF